MTRKWSGSGRSWNTIFSIRGPSLLRRARPARGLCLEDPDRLYNVRRREQGVDQICYRHRQRDEGDSPRQVLRRLCHQSPRRRALGIEAHGGREDQAEPVPPIVSRYKIYCGSSAHREERPQDRLTLRGGLSTERPELRAGLFAANDRRKRRTSARAEAQRFRLRRAGSGTGNQCG